MSRPIGIDLFAGAGGLSLGFEQAGFDVVAAVEIDAVHCATHLYNFPHTAIIPHSVAGLTGTDIRKAAGIGNRKIDCIFGGPPCQGFSMMGQRSLEDPRNRLVLEFVRIVKELDAETFVFENVKGLTVGRHKNFLSELVDAFDSAGYAVRLPWKVMDAAWFGVPQHRERLILMGAKKGRKLPDYPVPTTNPADNAGLFPRLPLGPRCREALSDLPDADKFLQLIETDEVLTSLKKEASPYAMELRCLNTSDWHFGYIREWDSKKLTSSARTIHSDISRRRFSETRPGEVEPISRFFRLPPDGLSNTLRAGTDSARGAFTSPRPIHFKYARCITVREMARLHGFPDWFRFHSTKWHGARQVGNSVPPPLARAVATSVRTSLNKKGLRPRNSLKLENESLLGLEMSKAAYFFGVKPPPARRDRKSGARKRKQRDIERLRLKKRAANG